MAVPSHQAGILLTANHLLVVNAGRRTGVTREMYTSETSSDGTSTDTLMPPRRTIRHSWSSVSLMRSGHRVDDF